MGSSRVVRSFHFADVTHENNETQDFEPVVNLLAGSTESKIKEGNPATSSKPSTENVGLVLSGGLPTIPADIFSKIKPNHYVELSELLPEKIQDSILYPEGKKKKAPAIEKFTDWVLAFCTYSQALLSVNPHLGGDLLTFVGTVARLARDHPSLAWAAYERSFRANVVADPSLKWGRLDQELLALSLVKATTTTTSQPANHPPQKRKAPTCDKWNDGNYCPFKTCRLTHVCSVCRSPQHRATTCPSAAGSKALSGSQQKKA